MYGFNPLLLPPFTFWWKSTNSYLTCSKPVWLIWYSKLSVRSYSKAFDFCIKLTQFIDPYRFNRLKCFINAVVVSSFDRVNLHPVILLSYAQNTGTEPLI